MDKRRGLLLDQFVYYLPSQNGLMAALCPFGDSQTCGRKERKGAIRREYFLLLRLSSTDAPATISTRFVSYHIFSVYALSSAEI